MSALPAQMADQIGRLKEDRFKNIDRMRELTLVAEGENRDLSAEEAQEYDRLEKDCDEFEKRAGRLEALAGVGGIQPRQVKPEGADGDEWLGEMTDEEKREEARSRRVVNLDEYRDRVFKGEARAPKTLKEFQELRTGVRAQDSPEYRWSFYRWLTTPDERSLSPEELRVLSKASAGAGLNLVPTAFARTLVDLLRFTGVMREISNIVTTDSGEALQVPSISAHGTASWTAENAAFSVSDETFGQLTLNAYKAATIMLVSEELLADSAFDLEAFIGNQFSQRIGVLENTAYVAGDGTGKPTGVTTQASTGVTAGGASAMTGDDLIGLYYSLLVPYRRNAVFVVADSSMKLLRLLKDSQGRYLFEPALTAGTPDTILAKPIYADPDMAAATTGLISALFGDFSYYWIRDVNGIAFQRLNELYAANGQVGFRAYHRTDGKLTNTAAIKKLTQP